MHLGFRSFNNSAINNLIINHLAIKNLTIDNKQSTINISMKKAYVFPGQGSQFVGMGKDLYEQHEVARQLFEQANEILGFNITEIMFNGTDEELKQTRVTQPAIFLHSVAQAAVAQDFNPDMVAGHSLGEFSALVASKVLSFEDGLRLVYKRAMAMQTACEANPSTMAAILGLDDAKVEEVCASIEGEVVVAANYNCPGQLVISGSNKGIEIACEKMKEAGAKRALPLPVGGAFHSPLMKPAEVELAKAINETTFSQGICPIYQNVDAMPHTDPQEIKQNLISQLTAPVRWTQSVQQMVADGATHFVECGPGKVLQGLVKKIERTAEVSSVA
ncbi:malonyl CoA-acyl carrier protein transacylase [Pontibacter amylolyticus]|uniref:Malonyl CoA-acyl carrier protein transacylase n=2 Tax=Pontibacter amylolyticus TaxID=1424080 RepID=A0ABQ1VZ27_9BACT|nr:malonyl CoA-acyl carrier protein transacylase [Pontibacter amylolyticus]